MTEDKVHTGDNSKDNKYTLSRVLGEGITYIVSKIFFCLVILCLVLSQQIIPAVASDPGQSGWATFYGTNPMIQQWNIEINAILKSSMVNSNGVVTACVSGGYDLLCIENATGQIVWKARSANQLSGVPEISGIHGCIISSSDLGEITGYSIKTGEREFNVSTGWAKMSQPVLSEKYLLVRGYDPSNSRAGVIAINISKAQIAWKCASTYSSRPPCANNGRVFVSENKKIVAINENDGTKLWEKELSFDLDFISSRGEYVSLAYGKTVMFLSAENGNLIKQLDIEDEITQSPSFDATQCYIVSFQGKKLECFNIKNGKSLWSVKSEVPYFKPQLWKDGIIAPSLTCVQTIDRQTGKLLWDISVVGQLAADPIAINDYMIIPTAQRVYAFRNAGFEIQIGANSLDLGIMTSDEPFSNSKVQIFNYSGSKLNVSCETIDPWLVVVPDRFEIGAHDSVDVNLSADMRSVDDGIYSSKIKINWQNGTREVAVAAKKVKLQDMSKPKPGLLKIDSTIYDTSARLGQQNPVFQFTITNEGDLQSSFTLSSLSPWMLISSKSGVVRGRSSAKISVCLITSLAMMGLNEGLITIKSGASQPDIEFFVRFWRDPGVETKICEFDLGSSIATISGVKVRARPEPHLKNNVFMLPLNFIHLLLDCKLEKLSDIKYRLTRDNVSMILEIGSSTCEIFTPKGLNKLKLEAPVSLRSGLVAVPVTVLENAYKTKLTNNGNHYVFEIELPELE